MKKILSFLLLALVTFQCSGQRMGARNYNFGTAKKLNGSVCVVTVFIEDGYVITQSEKDNYISSLNAAEQYLKTKASSYNKNINFINKITQGSYKYTLYTPLGDTRPYDIMKMIMGSDYYPYLNDLRSKYNSVIVIMCMHLDPERRNHAWMNNSSCSDNLIEGITLNLTYHAINNLNCIIAHEMLHCFGARDFYKIGDSGVLDSRNYASYDEKMGHSLMGPLYGGSIYDYEIDDATAYLIGFTDTYKDWFNQLYYKGIN